MMHSVLLLFYFNIIHESLSLVALPTIKENTIMKTEASIRDTVNGLIETLKTAPEKVPKLEQYLRIHNHFLSQSLKDYHNMNEIKRLTRVPDSGSTTKIIMDTINDILNENTKENDFETPNVRSSHKANVNFEDIDKLTAKYKVSHNETKDSEKITEIEEKIKEIEGTTDNINKSDNDKFWVERSRRIFAGKKTKINKFPFVVVVQIFGQFYCAGALIGDDLVITAASCLQLAWNNRHFRENLAHVTVRVGSTFPNIGGEVIAVIEIYFNPNYVPRTLQANLAIMRLARRINFEKSSKVKKIIYDQNPSQIPFSTAGISLLGWGAKDGNNKLQFKTFLQFAKLDIIPITDCQEIYTKQYVRQENICVGYATKGGGACNHDLGDPGVVNNVLVGIVSFASPVCGRANAPTVLTKLGYYSDWINSIIEMEPPNTFAHTTRHTPTLGTVTVEEVTIELITPIYEDINEVTTNNKHKENKDFHCDKEEKEKKDNTLLKYFNYDEDLYERFFRTCNDEDVLDFVRALKGHGLELQVAKRRDSKTVYLK